MEYLEEQLASDNLTDSQTKTAQEQLGKWKSLYENTQLMIDTIQKLNGTYEDPLTTLQQIDDKYGGGRSDAFRFGKYTVREEFQKVFPLPQQ